MTASESMKAISLLNDRSHRKHPWRLPWLISTLLHVGALGMVSAWVMMAPMPIESQSDLIQVDGRWGREPSDASVMELRSADSDPRWQEVIDASRDPMKLPNPSTSDLSQFVQKQIERSVRDGNRRTALENEDKLSRLSRRLSESSNQANVDEMTDFLGALLGKREVEAKEEDTNGDTTPSFDTDSAQIDRVREEQDSEGSIRYIATLIDAHGTTREIELDSESGAQLYRTMKLIEANPLLGHVYRKIVMGFLDQMLRSPTSK